MRCAMRMKMKKSLLVVGMALAFAAPAFALDKTPTAPMASPLGVPGVTDAQLDPAFWVRRLGADADRVLLDAKGVDASNERMLAGDPTIFDLTALPASIPRAQASEWISDLSSRPKRTLYDDKGQEIPAATLDGLVADANLAALPDAITPRYALVVERAALRSF